MASPEQQFDALMTASPAAPFVTYYDESSGERSELSVKSLANWVAKTHFLLTDELGLGPGDRAFVSVPLHWISVPVLLGCLTAGVELSDDPADAAVGFVTPDSAADAAAVADVFAVAPTAAAIGFGDAPPDGTRDYVRSVRPQPDVWRTVRFGATEDDPAMDGRSRAALTETARTRADELGVTSGARLLVPRDISRLDDWLDALFVPLAVAGSVVYVVGADEAVLARRADQERVTVTV
jgi:uncharacterized protein (TIGR03089 family)